MIMMSALTFREKKWRAEMRMNTTLLALSLACTGQKKL